MRKKYRSFKLIGLRVLEGCSRSLRKVLCPETTYFFCNDYEDDGEGFVRKKIGVQELSPDFFCIDSPKGPLVNISCVVGKNGDGKSSLIELLIRLINNFSYVGGYLSDCEDLSYMPKLCVSLFFLVDSDLCRLRCRFDDWDFRVGGKEIWQKTVGLNEKRIAKGQKKTLLRFSDKLFYTLVSNYSLYAYNSEEFKDETFFIDERGAWIKALFQKQDSYQIPILLSPKRDRGIIDVNVERQDSMQRLNELFLNCEYGKYHVRNDEVVEGFMYRMNDTLSYLTHITIGPYLQDESLGFKNIILLDQPLSEKGKKRYNAINLKAKQVLLSNLSFWDSFDNAFYETGLLRFAYKWLYFSDSNKSLNQNRTDLYEYLQALKKRAKSRRLTNVCQNIERFLGSEGRELTFLQFQRIYLVFEVFNY